MRPIGDVLLRRAGLVFVEPGGAPASADQVRAVELELAHLGYVASSRLRARLALLGLEELTATCAWMRDALARRAGGGVTHEPLFRSFPDGIPADTEALWWKIVLVHYLQADDQPCLWCRRTGTTHVLQPCRHVVCARCFDGASYSACPVCGRAVDRGSPFFEPSAPRMRPDERVTYQLLDLGDDLDGAARGLVTAWCARAQPMAPDERADLVTVLKEVGARALPWLPEAIPVKEHMALALGTLFACADPAAVLPVARAHLRTATDVLRFVVALSGGDPALQGETVWQDRVAKTVKRFKIAKLSRRLRRGLLAILDALPPDRLFEDVLRHRSYWVWVGEFLHPHEYASRYPVAARAFQLVRTKAPDGTPAPGFRTFASRVEAAVAARDVPKLVETLRARPGELARRFDHAVRLAGSDHAPVVDAFTAAIEAYATPMLFTLRAHLDTRRAPAARRVYWPRGTIARGVFGADARAPLPADAIAPARRAIDAELVRRFAALPAHDAFVIDDALRTVIAPFNERTAAPSMVALPRGSTIAAPLADHALVRLFLHWCQPPNGRTTDLDLSVAFYDDAWRYVGVCSYYQLRHESDAGGAIATSAGDRQDAPFPDGATELVDVDRARARASGHRYAVAVINAYAGLKFGQLERAFAGVMLRDDPGGHHFDPRTVALRFELRGDHGVYLPFVLDLETEQLHWLDVHARGQFELNNVETSTKDVATICPRLIAYFASGARPSMYDVALLHAAARARRVYLRGPAGVRAIERGGDDALAFHARLVAGAGVAAALPAGPVFAAVLRGDLALAPGSACYAVWREGVVAPVAAAELLA